MKCECCGGELHQSDDGTYHCDFCEYEPETEGEAADYYNTNRCALCGPGSVLFWNGWGYECPDCGNID